MKLYNVRERRSVLVPDDRCTKRVYSWKGRLIYAVRCTIDGTRCTRFLTKAAYDALKCPEQK